MAASEVEQTFTKIRRVLWLAAGCWGACAALYLTVDLEIPDALQRWALVLLGSGVACCVLGASTARSGSPGGWANAVCAAAIQTFTFVPFGLVLLYWLFRPDVLAARNPAPGSTR